MTCVFPFSGNGIARRCAYSWIGRTGDGYRYDYVHVGHGLAQQIEGCAYLHETRERRLTDHAAVTLSLRLDAMRRAQTIELGDGEPTLF
jgi:exodeoxyribonuclease-3